MILATAMFYFNKGTIVVGGFGFMYHYLLAGGILLLAMWVFLVRLQLERAILLIKYSFILSIPYYVPLILSFIVWIMSFSELRLIIREIFVIVYQFLGIGVAAATLYLFGKKGIWYCLASMILAYMLRAAYVIAGAGLAPFLIEFKDLLLSFSAQTGPLMRQMEIHDQTFAFGTFLIFLLLNIKEVRHIFWWLSLTLLCFLLGFKRIAFMGLICAIAFTFILHFFSEKAARQIAIFIAYVSIIASFLYIVTIRYGLFDILEKVLHINTMGRRKFYEAIKQYYEINVAYMGKGMGFLSSTNWMDNSVERNIVLHNDFLRMYIEAGFLGYFAWIWSHFVLRMEIFFRKQGKKTGLMFFALFIYSYINYLTDNTVYYHYTNMAFSMVMLACCLSEDF